MRKRKIFWLAFCAGLCLGGCSRKVYVPVISERVSTDTVYRSAVRTDSVWLRDSVVVGQRGDTVVKEVWRWRDRRLHTTDTLWRSRRDTVRVEVPVVAEGAVGSLSHRWHWALGGALAALLAVMALAWRRR